jgi:hypothetical protein
MSSASDCGSDLDGPACARQHAAGAERLRRLKVSALWIFEKSKWIGGSRDTRSPRRALRIQPVLKDEAVELACALGVA